MSEMNFYAHPSYQDGIPEEKENLPGDLKTAKYASYVKNSSIEDLNGSSHRTYVRNGAQGEFNSSAKHTGLSLHGSKSHLFILNPFSRLLRRVFPSNPL